MSIQDELAKPVLDETVLALKFAVEKQQLSLHAVDVEWIAAVMAKRSVLAAVRTGAVVERAEHERKVAHHREREHRFNGWWASAMVQSDQQLQRVQTALAGIEDRALAKKLANEIGVILPEVDDALFEVGAA